jgi:uncharacterized membrane protein
VGGVVYGRNKEIYDMNDRYFDSGRGMMSGVDQYNGARGGNSAAEMVVHMVFMVLMVVVAYVVIKHVVRYLNAHAPAKSTPEEVAKMRYAEGKITKDEYEQLKKDLK